MFPFRKIGLMLLILSLVLVIALPALVVAQDDPLTTNTPLVTPTLELSSTATQVVGQPPVATLEPTAPAGDTNLPPKPSDENNPTDNVILMGILTFLSYLGWCSSLAVSVSVSIELIKPKTIEPFKDKLLPDVYLTLIYGLRLILTIVGFFYMWGGIVTARTYLAGLPPTVPDAGIAVGTILLITLGEEFTHSVIDRFKAFGDVAKILIAAKQAEIKMMNAQTKNIPWANSPTP